MMKPLKVLGLLPILVASAAPLSLGDEATKRRVEQEFPAAMQKLKARYDAMQGKAIFREDDAIRDKPGRRKSEFQLDFAFAPGSSMMSTTGTKVPDRARETDLTIYRRVYSQNPDYFFGLESRHPDDELALTRLDADPIEGRSTVMNYFGYKVQCTLAVGGIPLYRPMASGLFRVDDATQGFDGDPKKILVRYTIVPLKGVQPPKRPVDASGWMVVSPDEGWIIHDSNCIRTIGKPQSYLGHVDYARSPDGHLDPVKVTQKVWDGRFEPGQTSPDTPLGSYEIEFGSVKYQAPPESTFRLPAFGMPEADPK